jgi:hypothetical protein
MQWAMRRRGISDEQRRGHREPASVSSRGRIVEAIACLVDRQRPPMCLMGFEHLAIGGWHWPGRGARILLLAGRRGHPSQDRRTAMIGIAINVAKLRSLLRRDD